jgi:hypothetical protein
LAQEYLTKNGIASLCFYNLLSLQSILSAAKNENIYGSYFHSAEVKEVKMVTVEVTGEVLQKWSQSLAAG